MSRRCGFVVDGSICWGFVVDMLVCFRLVVDLLYRIVVQQIHNKLHKWSLSWTSPPSEWTDQTSLFRSISQAPDTCLLGDVRFASSINKWHRSIEFIPFWLFRIIRCFHVLKRWSSEMSCVSISGIWAELPRRQNELTKCPCSDRYHEHLSRASLATSGPTRSTYSLRSSINDIAPSSLSPFDCFVSLSSCPHCVFHFHRRDVQWQWNVTARGKVGSRKVGYI